VHGKYRLSISSCPRLAAIFLDTFSLPRAIFVSLVVVLFGFSLHPHAMTGPFLVGFKQVGAKNCPSCEGQSKEREEMGRGKTKPVNYLFDASSSRTRSRA